MLGFSKGERDTMGKETAAEVERLATIEEENLAAEDVNTRERLAAEEKLAAGEKERARLIKSMFEY
jgi:hypothetical protein